MNSNDERIDQILFAGRKLSDFSKEEYDFIRSWIGRDMCGVQVGFKCFNCNCKVDPKKFYVIFKSCPHIICGVCTLEYSTDKITKFQGNYQEFLVREVLET